MSKGPHWIRAPIHRIAQWSAAVIFNGKRYVRVGLVRGQGLVEYALILVLIAIVVIGIVTTLGGQTSRVFSQVNCTLGGQAQSSSSHPGNPQGGGQGIANNTTTTDGCD